MNTIAQHIRKAFLTLAACATACLGGVLSALEISDIPYPLTREQADKTLSKDYTYALLADGTVRRTWNSGNKTIFIDFNTNTNEALLIAIIYNPPVAKKDAIDDAHTLAKGLYADNAKWDSPKDKASKELISGTFGLSNAKRKKLSDRAMLFYEMNDKGNKATRVSLFASLPSNNRWELHEVRPGATKTAMGTNWSDDFVEAVYKDEARRQAAPVTAEKKTTATAATESDTAPVSSTESDNNTATHTPSSDTPAITPPAPREKKNGVRTAMGTRRGGNSSATTPTQNTRTTQPRTDRPQQLPGTTRTLIKEGKPAETVAVSTLPPPPDFLKDFGVENPEWWHYLVLGIVGLILLFIIFRTIGKAKQRAAHQKQFNRIVGGNQRLRR